MSATQQENESNNLAQLIASPSTMFFPMESPLDAMFPSFNAFPHTPTSQQFMNSPSLQSLLNNSSSTTTTTASTNNLLNPDLSMLYLPEQMMNGSETNLLEQMMNGMDNFGELNQLQTIANIEEVDTVNNNNSNNKPKSKRGRKRKVSLD